MTTIVYNNAAYAILRMELLRVGAAGAGRRRAPCWRRRRAGTEAAVLPGLPILAPSPGRTAQREQDWAMDVEWFLAAAGALLAVPSTADRPAELERALGFVLNFVGPGFTVERFASGGKPSALVYRAGHDNARNGPASGSSSTRTWTSFPAPPEQFRPRRDEGMRLYARGAQDMKISALAEALAFRELAGAVEYPLALQLVTDEELGGRDGTRYQIERGVRGQFVVIGETSGLRIVTESKGMLGVTLRASGRGGHSAYPWLGDNALVKLQRSVHNVLARYPVATEEAWRTTVNVARVHAPNQARDQIPAEAEAWLDIRFPAEDTDLASQTPGQIAAYLQGCCEPGVTAVVDHLDRRATPTPAGPRSAASGKRPSRRATSRTSCASTAPVTGGSTGRPASRRWPSAWAGTASTAPRSAPTSPRSSRTTRH